MPRSATNRKFPRRRPTTARTMRFRPPSLSMRPRMFSSVRIPSSRTQSPADPPSRCPRAPPSCSWSSEESAHIQFERAVSSMPVKLCLAARRRAAIRPNGIVPRSRTAAHRRAVLASKCMWRGFRGGADLKRQTVPRVQPENSRTTLQSARCSAGGRAAALEECE